MQEVNELFRIKKARAESERVNKVEFKELLMDYYCKVGDNHDGPLIDISLTGPFKEGYLDNQDQEGDGGQILYTAKARDRRRALPQR